MQISLVKKAKFYKRSKHIDVRYQCIIKSGNNIQIGVHVGVGDK